MSLRLFQLLYEENYAKLRFLKEIGISNHGGYRIQHLAGTN